MRTTLNLDPTVVQQLKEYQQDRGTSLGALASELLAKALAETTTKPESQPLDWISRPMAARVDLEDWEAVEQLSSMQYESTR